MLNRFSLGFAVFMFTALAFQVSGQQTQPKPMGRVHVWNNVEMYDDRNERVNFHVFVTLYKDGQSIRTTELAAISNNNVEWSEVPAGALEVHFEARGYGKVIKRITVVRDGYLDVTLGAMDKKDELWGAGPSLFELQKRIETLESANIALRTEVTSLKTDVAALKKAK